VQQQTLAPQLQMFGRQAVQRLIKQLCAEYAPVNEGGLDTLPALPVLAHMLAVAAGLQSSQAALELGAPPGMEVRAVQIHPGSVDGAEQGGWPRMEDRLPAQQAEQAGD